MALPQLLLPARGIAQLRRGPNSLVLQALVQRRNLGKQFRLLLAVHALVHFGQHDQVGFQFSQRIQYVEPASLVVRHVRAENAVAAVEDEVPLPAGLLDGIIADLKTADLQPRNTKLEKGFGWIKRFARDSAFGEPEQNQFGKFSVESFSGAAVHRSMERTSRFCIGVFAKWTSMASVRTRSASILTFQSMFLDLLILSISFKVLALPLKTA